MWRHYSTRFSNYPFPMLKQQLIDAELRLAFELSRTFAFPKLGWTTSSSRATLQRRQPGGKVKLLLRLLMVKRGLLTKMQRQCNLLSVKFKRARCVRQNRRSLRPKRTRIRVLTTDRHDVRTSELKFFKLRIYNF